MTTTATRPARAKRDDVLGGRPVARDRHVRPRRRTAGVVAAQPQPERGQPRLRRRQVRRPGPATAASARSSTARQPAGRAPRGCPGRPAAGSPTRSPGTRRGPGQQQLERPLARGSSRRTPGAAAPPPRPRCRRTASSASTRATYAAPRRPRTRASGRVHDVRTLGLAGRLDQVRAQPVRRRSARRRPGLPEQPLRAAPSPSSPACERQPLHGGRPTRPGPRLIAASRARTSSLRLLSCVDSAVMRVRPGRAAAARERVQLGRPCRRSRRAGSRPPRADASGNQRYAARVLDALGHGRPGRLLEPDAELVLALAAADARRGRGPAAARPRARGRDAAVRPAPRPLEQPPPTPAGAGSPGTTYAR